MGSKAAPSYKSTRYTHDVTDTSGATATVRRNFSAGHFDKLSINKPAPYRTTTSRSFELNRAGTSDFGFEFVFLEVVFDAVNEGAV